MDSHSVVVEWEYWCLMMEWDLGSRRSLKLEWRLQQCFHLCGWGAQRQTVQRDQQEHQRLLMSKSLVLLLLLLLPPPRLLASESHW